jgi:molybdopterin-guanine dinucleotide biosynthesis protein B
MPPVVAIVGKSKSGKTTLIEKLISELKSRGYRVGTVKHAPLEMDVDKPGKDSWRHIRAGSEATAIVSSDRIVLIKPVTHSVGLDEVIRFFGEDYDIILAEGFKQSGTPKIEVHRKEVGPPLSSVRKLIVIATDEPLETKTRQFSLQDITGLADLLENGFIKPQRERISIYVNNNPISLTAFWPWYLA